MEESGVRYQRVQRLGGGETAETWLCKDRLRGDRLVAQKVFSREWSRDAPDLVDREFCALAAVAHPYIASILDFGEENGVPYLVSEYVEGRTLLDHLRGRGFEEIALVFVQVLEALDYLYFRNLVHLDLKPENILVQKPSGGRGAAVKLIDFGLATRAHGVAEGPHEAIGSPPFTAPELALGRPLDTRSDLYSVGVLLYAALAGRLPYDGEELVEILNEQLRRDPEPLRNLAPAVPVGVATFVERLMARDPGERPDHPRAALRAFEAALGETFPVARAAPIPVLEDPEIVFRPDLFEDLLSKILKEGGLWAVRGEAGSGKTFLARWLERALWKERRPVVSWSGERVVLAEDARLEARPEAVVIVDDADRGPVAEWLAARTYRTAVVFGENAEAFRGPEWSRADLKRVTRPQMTDAFRRIFEDADTETARRWMERSGGLPGELVRIGRRLVRCGALQKAGAGWRWGDPPSPEAFSGGERHPFVKILSSSRIALDADEIAFWTGQSVVEVEEGLKEFADPPSRVSRETTPADQAASVLRRLYDEGRYADGLDLLDSLQAPPDPALAIVRARFFASAGFPAEALGILNGASLSSLGGAERRDALETRGKALLFAGRVDEATNALKGAAEACERDGDADGEGRAVLHLGIASHRKGDREKARGYYERALRLAPKTRDPLILQGAAELNLANLHYDLSEGERAEALYLLSLEHLKQTPHGAVTAQAYLNYAALCHFGGRLLKASRLCREALRLAIDCRYVLTQGRALLLLAMIHEREGRSVRQLERLSEAVAIFEKAGLSFEAAQALVHRAYCLEAWGKDEKAEADAREALARAGAIRAADLEAQARLILGKTAGKRGRREEAASLLRKARDHFRTHGNAPMTSECERALKHLKEADRG